MVRFLGFSAAIVLLFAGLALADQPQDTKTRELLATVKTLDDAFVTRDVSVIRKFCAPNHISVASRYQFFDLEEQIKDLPRLKLTSNEAGEKRVIWLDDDIALVTYDAELVGTYAGENIDSTVRILATWILKNGNWIELAYQETELQEAI